jgi:glycosyltransferase involved in cell wall biosynthesis
VPIRAVALNALFLDPAASGGPETYLRGLVPALAGAFPDVRFTVFTTRAGARALRADGWGSTVGLRALPCDEGQRGRRTMAEQVLLPALARRGGFDVLHSLASVAPIRARVATVITLHDLTFVRLKTFGAVTTFGMRQIISRAAVNADAIITASAFSRGEIAERLSLDPGRIGVVPHGAGRPASVAPTDLAELTARYGLDGGPLVLCVASKRPHKNQELLVRALDEPLLRDGATLVLAGHPEPYDAELRALAASLGVAGRVRFVDYVPDADLEGLWQLASVAAFPTRAEGFGLPVVEALARGVPVACSDIPVLREGGGEHVRLFDPDDPADAARAIAATIAERPDGVAARAWAARYTWTQAARDTFEAYERAVVAWGADRRG